MMRLRLDVQPRQHLGDGYGVRGVRIHAEMDPMMGLIEPNETDENQIQRDNVVEQPRDDENQDFVPRSQQAA